MNVGLKNQTNDQEYSIMTVVDKIYARDGCVWCSAKFEQPEIRCRVCGNCQYCGRWCPDANGCAQCGNHLPDELKHSYEKKTIIIQK